MPSKAPKTKMTPVEVKRDLVHRGIEVGNDVSKHRKAPRNKHVGQMFQQARKQLGRS